MQIREWLNRPEYFYQPEKLFRRIFNSKSDPESIGIVRLPWKLSLEVDCSETIGRIISHHGIFELPVVEAIFRLTDPNDIFLDVGANIGYMTSAALSAGARKMISFEPHPDLFARLSRNAGLWIEARPEVAGRVEVRQEAMSSIIGTAVLQIPKDVFMGNQGLSTLEPSWGLDAYVPIKVITTTLDRVIHDAGGPIGVLKIDIEGHELQAFRGGWESLSSGMVRDIIYEDFRGMDSEASRFLSALGYSIFALKKTPLGPVLRGNLGLVRPFEPPNLLATLDPSRARRRMAGWGYRCLNRCYASE